MADVVYSDTTLDSAHDTSAETTINAMYEIDRSRNGGADYQFEEVVRGKEARRQLEATDCECCREYYEAVGPLPSRLQQPLWRSPTKSAARHHPRCGHREDDDLQANEDIQAHRQAISRHRQQWTRAKTPPSYWEIGFPSTQEAADINERAREMHRDKMRVVDTEAKKEGGRYRRR
ncbi:DNA repair protein endonuclease SAE2/CtIP C-terminus-domain-containing protein [Schizophyllum amplum]|uniref:DNA repair protein endonuclease SAE2/CtIP C-terminus-domain-containing protein n=1 Tax=Schizophyllum amplum TaxID=97359 RepID=A0A550C2Q5_9AGAR|nr:DNA repair protein endonuclease SAE2/CtIP C-terminus-domain-containing protein [Auriculariopsis ampla]